MTATGQPDSAIQKGFGDLVPGFVYADYNNLQSFKDAYVEGKTCAIMFEPVQGEGGVFPATDEFIQGIRKFCDEKGILFLLDEVQAGWGRCGSFMCYQSYGVKPDCVSMAEGYGRRHAHRRHRLHRQGCHRFRPRHPRLHPMLATP